MVQMCNRLSCMTLSLQQTIEKKGSLSKKGMDCRAPEVKGGAALFFSLVCCHSLGLLVYLLWLVSLLVLYKCYELNGRLFADCLIYGLLTISQKQAANHFSKKKHMQQGIFYFSKFQPNSV